MMIIVWFAFMITQDFQEGPVWANAELRQGIVENHLSR